MIHLSRNIGPHLSRKKLVVFYKAVIDAKLKVYSKLYHIEKSLSGIVLHTYV